MDQSKSTDGMVVFILDDGDGRKQTLGNLAAYAAERIWTDILPVPARSDIPDRLLNEADKVNGAYRCILDPRAGVVLAGGPSDARERALTWLDRESSIEHVVCDSARVVAGDVSELTELAAELNEEYGATLHLARSGAVLDADGRAVLDAVDKLDRSVRRESLIDEVSKSIPESWSGRPPLGYEIGDGGSLVPSDDYTDVVSVLALVDDGELSKRRAADRLDTSRRTIGRALDKQSRRALYGLD